MHHFRELIRKLTPSFASKERLKEEQYYLKNGSAVLEELIALCDGKSRIPLRYFSAIEIKRAIEHSEKPLYSHRGYMVKGLLDKRFVLISFTYAAFNAKYSNDTCRDIAITSQMSHLKNVLKLIGCCLEFEEPVLVYEYVEAITLHDLLFDARNSSVSWESRLRIANAIASAILYLHTEFTTPIIYVDLHLQKVLIDQSSGVANLFDFSSSISLPPGELEVEAQVVRGTCGYLAPEYTHSGIVTQKTDVFSFGVFLLQLLTGKKAFIFNGELGEQYYNMFNIEEYNIMDIVDPAILEENGIEIRQQLEDCLDLVKRCTLLDGEDRPYMIHVAREICRIDKCFHALTQGQT